MRLDIRQPRNSTRTAATSASTAPENSQPSTTVSTSRSLPSCVPVNRAASRRHPETSRCVACCPTKEPSTSSSTHDSSSASTTPLDIKAEGIRGEEIFSGSWATAASYTVAVLSLSREAEKCGMSRHGHRIRIDTRTDIDSVIGLHVPSLRSFFSSNFGPVLRLTLTLVSQKEAK